MARITGIGGIFFRSRDPAKLAAWYRDVLGMAIEDWNGALLRAGEPYGPPYTVWAPFEQSTDYFSPSSRELMVNFAVDDLRGFVEALKDKGIEILGLKSDDPAGLFAWVLDSEGAKIELWQPTEMSK